MGIERSGATAGWWNGTKWNEQSGVLAWLQPRQNRDLEKQVSLPGGLRTPLASSDNGCLLETGVQMVGVGIFGCEEWSHEVSMMRGDLRGERSLTTRMWP